MFQMNYILISLVFALCTQTLAFTQKPICVRSLHPSCARDLCSPKHKSSCESSLRISLDDDWESLTSVLGEKISAIQTVDILSVVTKDFQDVGSLSEQWFASVGKGLWDGNELIMGLPLIPKITLACIPIIPVILSLIWRIIAVPENFRRGMEPYPRGNYDPIQAKAYYARNKILVAQRAVQVLRLSNKFLFSLWLDKNVFRNEESQRTKRAAELLELVTKLGPTAIKVGQALSVRPDLIPPEYASALSSLQDRVPPFSGPAAKVILMDQLGNDRLSQLEGISLDKNKGPVASASIGQVYRCFIGDKEVAVKVQRPNVLADIALDLHLVREFAPIWAKITKTASDLQGLSDEWGRGFIAELDYRTEAFKTIRFTEEMKKRNLNAVTAPTVVSDFSTEQVLVTEWVDGTRLDKSDAEDVPRLCSVALNAYLVMLLELESLHCDPHPGNLLRTKDGRLCILDFGMTLDIEPTLQYSLLEYVAHLTSDDFEKLPEDFVQIGFLKPEKLEYAKRAKLLEPLKYFLKQLGKGGGASSVRNRIFEDYREKYPGMTDDEIRVEMRAEMKTQVNEAAKREGAVTGITVEVEELQRQNQDAFQIPEWFLYTSRAFLTLEGISLSVDEEYSIIKSCFPYVAKRLLGDDSPRAQNALRDLLYGAGNMIDVDRVSDLADGFSSYTTTSKTINTQAKEGQYAVTDENVQITPKERRARLAETEASITLAKDSADIFLAPDGNLMQNLLVEESALAASASVKDSLRQTFVDGPKKFRESLPFGVGSLLPELPFEEQVSPFVAKTEKEIKAQDLADKLISMVQQQQGTDSTKKSIGSTIDTDNGDGSSSINKIVEDLEPEQLALLSKELRENLPRYGPLMGALGGKFVSTFLETASDNIEGTLANLESKGMKPAGVTEATARSFSSAARQGASAISGRATTLDTNDETA